jgi:hypothetical protein
MKKMADLIFDVLLFFIRSCFVSYYPSSELAFVFLDIF